MAFRTTVRKLGAALGVSLPAELVRDLGLSEGDEVYLVPTPDGLLLAAPDSGFSKALDASAEFMRRYPSAMRALAE